MSVKSRLAAVPTPIGGLALGIASLSWLWETRTPADGLIQASGAALAAAIAVLLVLKFAASPRTLMVELSHPVVGSVLPTLAMATMVVSASVGRLSPALAAALWLSAVAAHLGFLLVFVLHRAREPHLVHMVPSWFVPPIGPVVAVLTVPSEGFHGLAQGLLWFGIVSYAAMLPLMLFRLIFREAVPVAAKPTIAILAAPPNLCLAGYLTFEPAPDPVLAMALLGLGILMAAVVYLAFWELLRLPFSPAYAAFTFPVVIAARASFQAAAFLAANGTSADTVAALRQWGEVELAVATAVVVYVALRYAAHYLPKRRPVAA
jgi:tellurite resistance protein TehA-like permease